MSSKPQLAAAWLATEAEQQGLVSVAPVSCSRKNIRQSVPQMERLGSMLHVKGKCVHRWFRRISEIS